MEILKSDTDHSINFKGMMVGNPAVDWYNRTESQVTILYFHGLLPEHVYTDWVNSCTTFDQLNTLVCSTTCSCK